MKTQQIYLLIFILMIVSNCLYAQSYRITPWANNKKAAVTVTLDDNTEGQFLYGIPKMNEKGIKSTLFVNGRTMDWSLATEAINSGHEIGNHTLNHKNLLTLDTVEIEYEIKTNFDIIRMNVPSQHYMSFSYPGGQGRGFTPKDDTVRMFVKKYHINGRGIKRAGVNIGSRGYDSYNEYLNPLYVDYYYQTGTLSVDSTISNQQFDNALNAAISDGGWFSPLYHGIETKGITTVSLADFTIQMDIIDSKKEYCWITTFGQATCYHKERQAATLTELSFNRSQWILELTDTLDNNFYREPLTIRLFVPDSVVIENIQQANEEIAYFIEGDTVQFNAVPDGGEIIIKQTTLCDLTVSKAVTLSSTDSCTGNISLSVFGGLPPYQISWAKSESGSEISNLCEGWYQYTVIDANDCKLIDSAFVAIQTESQGINGRKLEAVILEGREINKLIRYAANKLVGFRYDDNGWTQIPVQVDEKDSVDGRKIFGDIPAEDFPEIAWGENLEIYKTLAYCDSNTWVGLDHNPLFDYNDELLFMVQDAGSRAESIPPTEVNPVSGVEIMISDPLNDEIKYVYLFEQNGSLDPAAGKSYVHYNYNLFSGSYKDTYKITNGPNPEHSYVTTPYYQQHFSDRYIRDELKILADGSSGMDILDRHRNLLDPILCFRNEDTFSSGEGAFQANISGPIRAIRSYYGANSGPLLQRDHFFYEQKDLVITRLQMHGIKGFLDLIDYSPEATGMSYRNDKNLQALSIDGIPDAFNNEKFNWEQTFGPHGSLISFSFVDENIGLAENIVTFRNDDLAPIDFQCTGDTIAFGTVGIWINQPIPNTEPRDYSLKYLNSHRESYFFEPVKNDTVAVNQLITFRSNPLQIDVTEWNTLQPQPSGVEGKVISAYEVEIKWTDTKDETGYELRRSTGDDPFQIIATLPADSTNFRDLYLMPTQTYLYEIRSNYNSGNSSWTNSISLTTASDACTAPVGLESEVEENQAVLSWHPALNTTLYKLEYKLDGSTSFNDPVYTSETSYTLSGLEMDTVYIWQMTSLCGDRDSPRTFRQRFTVGMPYSSLPPVSPSNLVAVAISSVQISVSWEDNSTNDTGFLLERSTTPTGIGGVVVNRRLKEHVTTYIDRGLLPNTTYYYRVRSTNSNGDSEWSNQVVAKTLSDGTPIGTCDPPAGLYSENITSNSVTIGWGESEWADDYQVFYRKVGDPSSKALKLKSNGALSVTLTGLIPSTKYEWAVKSLCSSLEIDVSKLSKRGVFTTRATQAAFSQNTTEEAYFNIYPNPSDYKIHVTVTAKGNYKTFLVIYNYMGKEVYSKETLGSIDELIDLSRYGGKIFVAKVITEHEGSSTKQILIR